MNPFDAVTPTSLNRRKTSSTKEKGPFRDGPDLPTTTKANMVPIVPHMKSISVGGVNIAQDQAGRFSINDLQAAAVASGVLKDIRPNEWMALDQTQALAEILITENPHTPPIEAKVGRYGGTYVCKELVYAYAMWISAKFHLQVIRTFDAVSAGQLTSAAPAKQVKALLPVVAAAGMIPPVMRALCLMGIDKNAAAISANQIALRETGANLLELAGHTQLVSAKQAICYTPTELGSRVCMSPKAFNHRLAERGMQEHVAGHWVPTAKGRQHAMVLDTGKAHSNGAPIQQVKWFDSVLGEVSL